MLTFCLTKTVCIVPACNRLHCQCFPYGDVCLIFAAGSDQEILFLGQYTPIEPLWSMECIKKYDPWTPFLPRPMYSFETVPFYDWKEVKCICKSVKLVMAPLLQIFPSLMNQTEGRVDLVRLMLVRECELRLQRGEFHSLEAQRGMFRSKASFRSM